jgi:lysophospholipase L1-like esterase
MKKCMNYCCLLISITLLVGCGHLKKLSQEELNSLYPPASTLIQYHTDWSKSHYPKRIEQFKKDPLNFKDIVFIGNSITEIGGDWSARFGVPNVKNRGISGDVTDGVLKRLDEITYFKPKAIFLLIGINDIWNIYNTQQIPSAAYIGNNILKITNAIHDKSPRTKIYVQTTLPTTEDYLKENISIVNTIIKEHESDGVYEVIDLHSSFINTNGLLKEELAKDRTHLNDAGYALWVDLVKQYVLSK